MTLGLAFPLVRLQAHTPDWAIAYAEERSRILAALAEDILGIEHVGSTAIPGVSAKPIIDIAIGVRSLATADGFTPAMAGLGYDYAGDGGVPGERIYGRGPRIRTHLVHAVVADSQEWRNYIGFRDALLADAALADEYDLLKIDLAEKFPNDRPSYTRGKGQFIEKVIRGAT